MSSREPRDGSVAVNGVTLHYTEWPGTAPALLCVHGLTANGRYWDAFAEQAAAGRRVIAVDLRGRGQSDKPPAGPYGVAVHAADMAALVRAIAGGPVVAVGHSLGSYICVLLAARHPELVSHLLLVDGGGVGGDYNEAAVRPQAQAALQRLDRAFPSFAAYLDYWRQTGLIQPWSRYFERYLAADVAERPDGSVVCRSVAAGIETDFSSIFREYDMERSLAGIQAPATVLWAPGGMPERPVMPYEVLNRVAALLPRGQLVTIAGGNHYTIVMAPDCLIQVTAALRELLAQA